MNEPLSLEHRKHLEMTVMTHRIIAFAFIGAIFLYGIVVMQQAVMGGKPGQSLHAGNSITVIVLYFMAISSIILSPVLKMIILKSQLTIPRKELTNESMMKLIARPLIGLIVAIALCESSALYGLILSMQTTDLNHFLILATLGIAGCIFHFPRYDSYERYVIEHSPS